jgi:Bacterial regulatory helix-turn-helix protein, lysR family
MKWTDRIGRRVKLRDLHIALVVAEAGSMTRAAEELAVSYPVVSKTISELSRCGWWRDDGWPMTLDAFVDL